jgi:predicted alpha/beta superfamily hydrolase
MLDCRKVCKSLQTFLNLPHTFGVCVFYIFATMIETILTLELTTTQDDRPVFVSGNFCNWYPDLKEFQMQKVTDGKYRLQFPADVLLKYPKVEYKYTRGGWDHAEIDQFGNKSVNRVTELSNELIEDKVLYWRNAGSTAYLKRLLPEIHVIDEEFAMPQLGTHRKINILLPADYKEDITKSYPVIYMQDAQNLFGDGSPYGNWEIDKRLSLLKNQGFGDVIVVALDHGDKTRYAEYSPYKHPNRGKGNGMRYANFIVRNLKPYIDTHFRTKPERQFTGIGGSSMGGLISIYSGFMYPETFGRLMVLSPSLWVSSRIYFDAVEFFNPLDTKIYLYGGGKESKYMIPNIEKLKKTIESQGFDAEKIQIKLSLDPKGKHNEKRWGEEFPKAMKWLFFD